jgi:phage putative head morphogenesis protein, SPP1 gp7 family
MNFKDIFKRTTPVAETPKNSAPSSDIVLKIAQEFQDRARKSIDTWRKTIKAAEDPEDPRWYLLQDMIDDLILDAHLSSVIDVRKMGTLNHRFYVTDINSGEQLDEQSKMLNKQWFYDFLDVAMDAIFRKYTLVQFFYNGVEPRFDIIPRRNVCPQMKRVYLEVGGNKFIDYSTETDVVEILHSSKFGLINTVAPNVIWKRNLMQSNAEFSERFGMPLITATTSNKHDVPRIEAGLKNLGEAGSGVLPTGSDIKVHALANAGNPEKVYLDPAKFHDNQVSKCIIGSTTMVDEGANRSQTQVHQDTLDDKISAADKRMIMFVVNDKLFPLLQSFGLPFDNTKMAFQFDETEDLSLTEQWKITYDAMNKFDLDEKELKKTFNLPIIGKVETQGGASAIPPAGNFKAATDLRALAVACAVNLPEYPMSQPVAASISKTLLDELESFDKDLLAYLYNNKPDDATHVKIQKAKRIAEELRSGLFNGWGKRRTEVDFNAPDHRALSMMEMNLFRFSEAKTSAQVLMLNRLLIDRDKLEIRSEKDFINQALKINANFNTTYLATEHQFAIATGQNSARWCEFMKDKGKIGHWEYNTVGDSEVRPEHAALDGRVFSLDDTQARRLLPPNGYKCRCEGLQYPGKPGDKLVSGKDYIDTVFPTDKMKQNFGINRADAGTVFTQNQMYLNELNGKKQALNSYSFKDYGLKPWSEMKDGLKPLKLDNTITPKNSGELFDNNADSPDYKAMGFEDYLKRKLILKENVFKQHITGKYIKPSENRHQLFAHVADILNNPDELWMRDYAKNSKQQMRYIKFYNNNMVVVDTEITNDGLEVKTWYMQKAEETSVRSGLNIK